MILNCIEREKKVSHSVHIVIIILDLGESSLAKGISSWSIQDLVHPVVSGSKHAELQLLLLLLHLVLTLEKQLGDLWKGLLHRELPEVSLLDFIPGELAATACCAAIVLITCASWLNHPESGSPHNIMASQDNGWAIWSLVWVDSVHLCHICQSLGDHLTWDLDAKVVMVLFGLFATAVHKSSAVGHKSIYNLMERESSD